MNYWVVGADWSGEDKTAEFLENGNWENGYDNKFIDLVKSVKVGDQIAIKAIYGQKHNLPFNNYKCYVSCMKIKAIGEVIENLGDGRQLKINWKESINEKIIYLYTYRPTIMRVVDLDVQKFVFEDQIQDFSELEKFYKKRSEENQMNSGVDMGEQGVFNLSCCNIALNRILYGAAGTGKTYHTINHALSIIENKALKDLVTEDRTVLKKRFDEYKEQGRIEFVTFHQSFSYEDFVEGIRAETKKNEKNEDVLHYLTVPGVFKRICDNIKEEQNIIDFDGFNFTDESIQQALNNLVKKAKTEEIILKTKTGYQFKLRTNQNGKLAARALSGKGSTTSLSHPAIVRYLKDQSDEIIANKSYEWAIAKELRQEVKSEHYTSDYTQKPYVLIIDEINRGNISRIFGELITLIEESKRAGAEEELSVTLPYSKQEFTVPNNVYIIGTMNSSDRSLTGLDIALRRRFTFIEMPPRPKLLEGVYVDGIDIKQLLTVINQRIEALLDRDHCIGHANFMHLNEQSTLKNLSDIFTQKIIPQLQEYFFDDWAKINLVLNDNGMLKSKLIEKAAIFPNVDSEDLGYFEHKKAWVLVPTSFDDIESFAKIIQH